MPGAIRGSRSLVLKIMCTTTLPQVCTTFLSPLQGLLPNCTPTQGLRPGLHSAAASRLSNCAASDSSEDVTDVTNAQIAIPFFPKMERQDNPANPSPAGATY